ncbi:50S ribosomal protein L19 [bacterium]|nr:50S ribosomal protein L19 [bacterium]
MNEVMQLVEGTSLRSDKFEFEIGDTVDVQVRILEGDKERLQPFSGIVISRRGGGTRENFTVRRIVEGEGVERTFPLHSPRIASVVVTRKSKVRRAKLYFLRDRIGKKAYRLKERPMNQPPTDAAKKPSRKGRKAKAEAAPVAAAPAVKASAAKKEKKRAARSKKKEA